MGFNDYLGPLVNVEGTTSTSTILPVDIGVGSFLPMNMYQLFGQSTPKLL